MKTGAAIPTIPLSMSTTEALIIMSEKSLGAVVVMADNHAVGIITDGDMRRNIDQLANKTVQDIATLNPHYVSADILAQEAAQVMSKLGITSCLVGSPTGNLEGFLHIHDCIVAGQS
jgi:arabinose-5-phosphate isomerase